MKHSWQEKGAKIEAYPPSGISFVSFTLFILDSVLSSVMRGGSEWGGVCMGWGGGGQTSANPLCIGANLNGKG